MTNAGDMNQAMMPSDCSFSETDLNDNITAAEESIDSVLKQAEWVHKKCDEKRAEWTTKLSRAESEVRQAVRDQFSQAFSYLELWEDQFQTELCEAFSKRRVLMEEKLNDINSLQTYLHRTMFTTMGRIKAAVESKDLPFQEANTLLDIAGKIMAEIKSVEVLPQITFHKVEEFFNDENQQRFGYLATLDVLPHQVVLLYPNNIVCGPIVFVVQVPQTRFMTTLTKSIESTIQVGERDPENLRVYQHNSNLEIVLNVESKETHVLSVKLYHQHVVGSPFLFHPTLNKQPYEDLKIKSSASHPLREDFDWVTDSTSEEEFISVTKESLRNQMSCSGIRMARKALLGKKQNIIRKRVKSEEQMDMCRKEKVSQRFTSQEEPTITTKFEVNIGNPANHKGKVDQFTNGNIADDEDDYEEKAHRAMLSNKQNTAMQPIDHEWFNPVLTSPNNEKGIEVNQNMNDGANHVKIEETIAPQSTECEENGSDDIMQKASRKAVKLSQPLRRPRLPACLTNVPGSFTYNISTKEIQSALSTEEIKNEPVTGKLVGEHHESSQGAYQKAEKQSSVIESREIDDFCKAEKKNEMAMAHQSEHFSKLIEDLTDMEEEYNVELENGSARVSNKYCFMGETCFHQKIIGVCTSRQDDWRNASEDKTFNYMLSQVSLFAGKQRNLEGKADKVKLEHQHCDDDDDCETEGQILNDCPHSLSAELVYIAYGPSDDSLFKPIGVAELPDGNVVVTDTFNDRIALFDSSGEFIKYFRTQSMHRPSAVVALQNGRYAVKDSHSITIFSNDECSDNTVLTGLKNPYGLTLNGEGDLMTVQSPVPGSVEVLTISPESGKIKKQLKIELCSQLEGKRLLSKPRFISYQKGDRLLIVDLGLNCVDVVDMKSGKLLFVFGEKGKQPGQFSDPSGIACDIDGYILVGDSRNHRVQIFNSDGNFVCVLTTNTELCRPSGMCLTSDGYLYILNYWDNSLAKYTILN